MATRAPSRTKTGTAVEVAELEEKAADALEQIDTLKGNYPDRKLLRSALLDLREHARAAKEQRESIGELLPRVERILEQTEDFVRWPEEEDAHPPEVTEIGEHRSDEEVEEPPKTWDDKSRKVELRAKKDKLKRKRKAHAEKMAQRKTNREDTSHERRMLLRLTIATVTAAIVFAAATMVLMFLTAHQPQPVGYVAPGASLALTAAMGLTATLSERSRRLLVAATGTTSKAKEVTGGDRS